MTRLRYTEMDIITKHFTFEYNISGLKNRNTIPYLKRYDYKQFANVPKH